jgi:hypothetical protein
MNFCGGVFFCFLIGVILQDKRTILQIFNSWEDVDAIFGIIFIFWRDKKSVLQIVHSLKRR